VLYSSVYIEFDPRPFSPAKPQRSDASSVVSLFSRPDYPPASRFSCPLAPSPFFASPFCTILGQCKSLSYNTYGSPRKCKQKTCAMANSFRCNTYKKHRGRGAFLASSNFLRVSCHETQVLSFHILAHSLAHFCNLAKLNSFLLKRFRTLCEKPPGVGCCRQPKPNNFGHPALSVTIARPCVARRNPHALWAQERKVGSEVRE